MILVIITDSCSLKEKQEDRYDLSYCVGNSSAERTVRSKHDFGGEDVPSDSTLEKI
jgi:hypothetical protein